MLWQKLSRLVVGQEQAVDSNFALNAVADEIILYNLFYYLTKRVIDLVPQQHNAQLPVILRVQSSSILAHHAYIYQLARVRLITTFFDRFSMTSSMLSKPMETEIRIDGYRDIFRQ